MSQSTQDLSLLIRNSRNSIEFQLLVEWRGVIHSYHRNVELCSMGFYLRELQNCQKIPFIQWVKCCKVKKPTFLCNIARMYIINTVQKCFESFFFYHLFSIKLQRKCPTLWSVNRLSFYCIFIVILQQSGSAQNAAITYLPRKRCSPASRAWCRGRAAARAKWWGHPWTRWWWWECRPWRVSTDSGPPRHSDTLPWWTPSHSA